jgi:inosine/xanthosine triphosphate pyrophosphatase family protein
MTKSTRPMVRIHDLSTNEVIDREMNDDEFAQHQADQAANAIAKAEAEAKQTAKAAILDRIGLTADELKTILG